MLKHHALHSQSPSSMSAEAIKYRKYIAMTTVVNKPSQSHAQSAGRGLTGAAQEMATPVSDFTGEHKIHSTALCTALTKPLERQLRCVKVYSKIDR